MPSTRDGYLMVKTQAANTPLTAVIPTHALRFKSGDIFLAQENIPNNPIQNNRASTISVVQGKTVTDGSFKLDVDPNEIVHWLRGGLGTITSSTDISSATDASVFSHQIDTADTLPFYTVEQYLGQASPDTTNNRQNYRVRRAFGTMIDSFKLSGADKLLELEVKTKSYGIFERGLLLSDVVSGAGKVMTLDQTEGLTSTEAINIFDITPQNELATMTAVAGPPTNTITATIASAHTVANQTEIQLKPQSPSYSLAAQVMSFAHCNFQFASAIASCAAAAEDNLENWELTFSNNLDARYGSQRFGPSTVAPRGYTTKLKATKYFSNRNDASYYFNITTRALLITINNGAIVSATDTNQAKYQIQIKLPQLKFTMEQLPTATDALWAYTIEAEGVYDTSAGYQFRAIVQCANAGTVYTA